MTTQVPCVTRRCRRKGQRYVARQYRGAEALRCALVRRVTRSTKEAWETLIILLESEATQVHIVFGTSGAMVLPTLRLFGGPGSVCFKFPRLERDRVLFCTAPIIRYCQQEETLIRLRHRSSGLSRSECSIDGSGVVSATSEKSASKKRTKE